MIGLTSHSGDTESSRPKRAHDNPVYHVGDEARRRPVQSLASTFPAQIPHYCVSSLRRGIGQLRRLDFGAV